jgi:RHS repeat-associated protein
VNGVTTSYVLDLNAGLTQVLSDGTNAYLYGLNRIGEQQPGGFVYHLPDALGSVRQLTNASGAVTLARSYEPYGSVRGSAGGGASAYGFAGEQQQGGLVYLRARYYASGVGRFVTRDTWNGDMNRPMSYNAWLYVYANPINLADPSGHDPWWCDWQPNPIRCYQNYWNALGSRQSGRWGGTPLPTSTPTLTPSPTCTPTPTRTPFPTRTPIATNTPYLPPDFDPNRGPTNLQIENWYGATPNNALAIERSRQVLEWLTYYMGPHWWAGSFPTEKEIATYLLIEEGGVLENAPLRKWMAKAIRYRLRNGVNANSLSGFTAFFNPNGGTSFNTHDWEELVLLKAKGTDFTKLLPRMTAIIDEVYALSSYEPRDRQGKLVLWWWGHHEMRGGGTASGVPSEQIYSAPYPDANSRENFYFGNYDQCVAANYGGC